MATITLTLPVSGTVITAGLHANNYTSIQSAINGGLDQNNFAAGKIFDNTKIMQGGAVTGQSLVWNGTSWVPGSNAPYRKTTAKTVNTSVAETDLLNGEITIGAGVMGTTKMARLTAWGDWKQNSGGTSNAYRFQLVLGATTLFDTNAPASVIADGAVRGRWKLVVTIQNATSASAQVADFELQFTPGAASQLIAATSVVFTTGQGIYQNFGRTDGAIPELHAGAYNASSENTALAKALVLNVINPSASANCETVLKGALVEVIP